MSDDGFKPVRPEDVTDLALLPGQFRHFAAEMKLALERVVDKIVDKILPAIGDIKDEQAAQRRTIDDHERRLAALEKSRARSARPRRK